MTGYDDLLTAEEFLKSTDERPEELVRGRIAVRKLNTPSKGLVCAKILRPLGNFVADNELGWTCSRSGVVTERNPDSVREADISFYHFSRIAGEVLPEGFLRVPPDLVVQVRSEDESWATTLARISEFLTVGVRTVSVVDPQDRTVFVCFPDQPPQVLGNRDAVTFPDILPGFQLSIAALFKE